MFRSSYVLGRVRGIEIGLNWSWLIIFLLLVWTLGASVFPSSFPHHSSSTYTAMAVVTTLLFFVSLLLHELGHAFRAQRENMEIEGITLWALGGVAKFKSPFISAGTEFRVAIAGPLVTLAIATLCLSLSLISSLPDSVYGVLAWLGSINALILIFNLLPAFPLDGGRILRSALWKKKDDYAWATHIAGNVGYYAGCALIGLSFFLFVTYPGTGALWLGFVGYFITLTARSEERTLLVREHLSGLSVAQMMLRQPITVSAQMSLRAFQDEFCRIKPHHSYPVLEGNEVVGLLNVKRVTSVPEDEWDEKRVRDYMTPLGEAPTCQVHDDLFQAMANLPPGGRQALVLEDGHLAGMLLIADVNRYLKPQLSSAGSK